MRTLGEEAYGFVPLMNNVISIAQIATVAINSMASRFVTVSLHKKDYDAANKYFSSVLAANIIICLILLIPSVFLVAFVNSVFDVPAHLLTDVRISFALLIVNFMISLCFSLFSVGTFAANRLDLSSVRTIFSQFARVLCIVVLFSLFSPSIVFTVIATTVATIVASLSNLGLTKKLVPQLSFSPKHFDKQSILTLFRSGIWNSIGTLSYDLFSGLDLIISNIFINASAMGVLSVSKTIPTTISSLISTIISVFLPSLTKYFATETKNEISKALNTQSNLLLFIICPILAFLVGFGDDFYSLWMPTLDAGELQILSILALLPLFVSLGSKGLANTFTVYNKIKFPSLATLGFAFLSTVSVFLLLNFTNLGIFAIAGTSSFFLILKEAVFVPIYAAKCMQLSPFVFFKNVFKCFFIVLGASFISYLFNTLLVVNNWISLIVAAIISSLAILLFIAVAVFGKDVILKLLNKI